MNMWLISTDSDLNSIDLSLDHANGGNTGIALADGYYPRTSADLSKLVTDSFELLIAGDYATIQNRIWQINRLIRYGKENQYGPLGTWLVIALDDGEEWRSRIYGGVLDYDEKMTKRIKHRNMRVGVILSRDPFWEGEEEQIPLSNGNGTNNTAGLNVYNCNDGSGTSPNKKNNYVEIAADVIAGDLPAPVRLEMTNNYNSSSRLGNVWIALNHKSNPANFQHIIEGEDDYGTGSTEINAACSDGEQQRFTWSGDIAVQIGKWTLNTAYLNYANKNYFKILANIVSSTMAGVKLQCKIMYPGGNPMTVVADSQEVSLTSEHIQEIGELQIPPWLLSSGDLAAVDLVLYARKTGGGSLILDYLQITPVDGYRVLVPRGYGAAYQTEIVDDGINEQIYTDLASGKAGYYTSIGKAILLEPGKLQRIYFLQKGYIGDVDIDRLLNIKAYYRPRRVGL